MKINSIDQTFFKGTSIESHAHTGGWRPDKTVFSSKDIFQLTDKSFDISVNGAIEKEEIKYVLISNLDCMDIENGKPLADELEGNMSMLKEQAIYPKHRPLAVCQTNYGGKSENIEKLLKENPGGFVGLKFHPEQFAKFADEASYRGYMELARKHNLPCLFHSGSPGSYSDPVKIYAQARNFPDVPVIMAHMGIGTDHSDATNVLLESIKKGDAKLYGDTSWMNPDEIVELIEKLRKTSKGDMTERILFGTDAPLGEFGDHARKIEGYYADYIGKIKSAIKTRFGDEADEIIDKIFYKNTNELFFEKKWAQNLQSAAETSQKSVKKTMSKTKMGLITFGAAAVIGVLGGILYNKYGKKDEQDKV